MKKLIIFLLIAITVTGCEKFLDKTPSEGGIVGFNDVSQFDAMLNEIRLTRNRYEWNHAIMASDDYYQHTDFQTANPGAWQIKEAQNVWNQTELKILQGTSNGFSGTYTYMYTLNYITDKIDNPAITGSLLLKRSVKAEAQFIRAHYFFNMLVQYCMHPALNTGQYPGLGYRNTVNTAPETYNDRMTVKYTLDKILEDLQNAEQMMIEVGKTDFNIKQPWRVTLTSVQALRARVELYVGNYAKAFEYAKKAYTSYSFLYDLNDQTLFVMENRGTLQTEVYNGVTYSVYQQSPRITLNASSSDPESSSLYFYKEAYYRSVCQLAALNKQPPSQQLYDLYEATDIRKKIYYDNNMNISTSALFPPHRKDELVSKSYMKHATSTTGSGYLLGVTVPEIMLIMAECRARGAGDGESANVIMKTLRKKRFPTTYVDNIGTTLKEVKEERRRELAFVVRWYDLKRYNALDKENIVVKKQARRDPYMTSSDIVTWVLAPNSAAYALPLPQSEIDMLGWPQNEYSGVSIQ